MPSLSDAIPARVKQLRAWTPERQQTWRETHPQEQLIFHVLLDASGSMTRYAEPLRRGYNLYLAWLQRARQPMAMLDLRLFGTQLGAAQMQALGLASPLTPETYAATLGSTELWQALRTVCTTTTPHGQHILIVFTDGQDNHVQDKDPASLHTLLTTLQAEAGWLCVYLGTDANALEAATALGFHPGNTLTFPNERIPEAFETLRAATQRYLITPAVARKLLAQQGIF